MDFKTSEIKSLLEKHKGDVLLESKSLTSVKFEGDKFKSIDYTQDSGIGARVFKDGKLGFFSTNSDDMIDESFKRALSICDYGDEIDFSLPGNPTKFLNLDIYDKELERVDESDMVSIGQSIIDEVKMIDSSICVNLSLKKSFIEKSVLNSNGLDVGFYKTIWGIEFEGLYVDKSESLIWLYDSKYSTFYDIDYSDIILYIANLFEYARSSVVIEPGKYTCIFGPSALYVLLHILLVSFNGENVFKGISVIGDKLEERVFMDKIKLVEDPHKKGGIFSQPFDDEGILTNYKELISDGVVKSFIYDLRYAYMMNTVTSGNGFRSYNSLPKPGFSNIILFPGENCLDVLISSIDKGLIIYNVLGGGMSNVNAGEFSVNVEMGLLIENGKIKGRVKDIMVSGNVFDLFSKVVELSSESRKVHEMELPYVMFDEVDVSSNR